MKKIRNQRGYVFFGMMAAIVGIAFSVLLITSSQSFKAFHNTTAHLNSWDTTALAAATIVSNESSEMLTELTKSIRGSLNRTFVIPVPDGIPIIVLDLDSNVIKGDEVIRIANNVHRTAIVSKYIADMNLQIQEGGTLDENIDYGLEIAPGLRHTGKSIQYIKSNFLPKYYSKKDKKLASTLLSKDKAKLAKLTKQSPFFGFDYLSGSKIKISKRTLKKIVGNHLFGWLFYLNLNSYGIIEVPNGQGIDIDNLPTGVKLTIKTNIDKNPTKKKAFKSKHTVVKYSTGQIRMVGGKSLAKKPNRKTTCHDGTVVSNPKKCFKPKICKDSKTQVKITDGFCYDTPYAPGCACYCDVHPADTKLCKRQYKKR